MRYAGMTLLLALFVLPALALGEGSKRDPIPIDQLSIEGVEKYVSDQGIMTVTELLRQLPEVMRSNYALIERSRSRQPSESSERPRMILYLPTGRFFMGISTDPHLANSDDVEMLEFCDGEGWRMGAITLGGDAVGAPAPRVHHGSRDTGGSCVACHGNPPRPIWGSYPTWPGAIRERLTAEQAAALTRVWSDENHPNQRLRTLLRTKDSWREGESFTLPNQQRGLPNETLNQVVANRHAEHLWNKVRRHPKAELLLLTHLSHEDRVGVYLDPTVIRDLRAFVGTEWNRGTARLTYPGALSRDWPLIVAGCDPRTDLLIDRTLPECYSPEAPTYDFADWNTATAYLKDVIRVRAVQEWRRLPKTSIEAELAQAAYTPEFGAPTKTATFLDGWLVSIQEQDTRKLALFLRTNPMPMLNLRFEKVFSEDTSAAIAPDLNAYARRLLSEDVRQRTLRQE